jgi:DNA-binding transcriptional regulator GbsR (MarR family)
MKNIKTEIDITKEVYSAMLEEFRQVQNEITQDMASHDKRLNLAVENHEYTDASKWGNISNGLYRALRVIDQKIGQLEMASKKE